MIDLKSFKNIHKNKDIYVLASGKSVDFISNDFFDNKIVIGINQAYKKVKCKYLLRKEYKMLETVIKLNPESIHFISQGNCGGNNNINLNYVIKNKDKLNKVVIYDHNPNNHNVPDLLPKHNKLVVSYSTITTGIHLAAYMGAKNIILVGHDCGTIDNECNFKDYHTAQTYKIAWRNGKKDYVDWLKKIENQTIKLKSLLKKEYNCNIYSLNPFINFNLEGHKYKK